MSYIATADGTRIFYYEDLSAPFHGANRPGSTVSRGKRDAFRLMSMTVGTTSAYDCVEAFSETDRRPVYPGAPHGLVGEHEQRIDAELARRPRGLIAMSRAPGSGRSTGRVLRACLCALALALLAALAGCGSTSAGAAGTSTAAAGSGAAGGSGTAITIKDFTFTTPASVSPGATVTVHNMDGLAHTVTADGGDFDSPAPAGNSTFTAPTKPGSYPFHCTIHPEMHGTLVVK